MNRKRRVKNVKWTPLQLHVDALKSEVVGARASIKKTREIIASLNKEMPTPTRKILYQQRKVEKLIGEIQTNQFLISDFFAVLRPQLLRKFRRLGYSEA